MPPCPDDNRGVNLVLALLSIVAAVLLLLYISGCAECQKLTQRCNNNYLQLCNTRGQWRNVANCKAIYTIEGIKECKCVCDNFGKCRCEASK